MTLFKASRMRLAFGSELARHVGEDAGGLKKYK